MTLPALAALAAVFGLAPPAAAAVTVYTSEAMFIADAGNGRAVLPAKLASTGSFFAAPFTFTAIGPGSSFVIDPATYGTAISSPGEGNLLLNDQESHRLTTTGDLYAFGFSMVQPNLDSGPLGTVSCFATCDFEDFTVKLYDGAAEIFSHTFTPASKGMTFRGFASPVAFNRIDIIDVSGGIDDEYFANYRFATTPVPLPAAAWLLLAGLGALGAAGRRRAA